MSQTLSSRRLEQSTIEAMDLRQIEIEIMVAESDILRFQIEVSILQKNLAQLTFARNRLQRIAKELKE